MKLCGIWKDSNVGRPFWRARLRKAIAQCELEVVEVLVQSRGHSVKIPLGLLCVNWNSKRKACCKGKDFCGHHLLICGFWGHSSIVLCFLVTG